MKKDASLDYKIYQTLIESDLTDDQKQYLVEIGLGQMLKSVWGGIKAIPASVADVFKSGMYNVQLVAAQENIKKEVDELRKIGQKLGKGDAFVNEFLYAIMKGAGLNPSAVGAVGAASSAGGQQGSTLAPGTKIDASDNDALIQALAQILSNITGKPAEEVQQQAQEKKVNSTKMSSVVSVQAAEKIGVPAPTVQKVVSALIKTGHLAMEDVRTQNSDSILTERWQKLAGLLTEGNAADQLARDIKGKKIKTPEELEKKLQGYAAFALKDVDDNFEQMVDAMKSSGLDMFAARDLEKKMRTTLDTLIRQKEAESQGTAAFKSLAKKIQDNVINSVEDLEKARKKYSQDKRPTKEEVGKLMDMLVANDEATPQEKEVQVASAEPAGKELSPEEEKKAEVALKKFASAADDVRKEVPDVDDMTLGKILDYFDGLPSIEIT